MRALWAIWRKELKSYFSTPLAYIILAAFLFFTGFFFYNILSYFSLACIQSVQIAQMYRRMPQPMNVNVWVVQPFFYNLAVISLFLIPLVTMRSFSEEKRLGTLELLITSPITNTSLIAAKFLSAYTMFLVMLAFTFIYQLILILLGKPDILPILSGYLGFALMGAVFVALGLFISALTENQILSAIISFALLLVLWVVNWASIVSGGWIATTLDYLSLSSH
ncbi:MAG: ABC transporter permease subunit, partial [bacterium]